MSRIGAASFALLALACADGVDLDPERDGGTPPVVAADAGPRDAGPSCGDGVCNNGCQGHDDLGERFVNCPSDCFPHDDCGPPAVGELCHASFTAADPVLRRDDCGETDNVCVPWDAIAGRAGEFTTPLHTCVKTCVEDRDCPFDRACARVQVPGATADLVAICVDELAEVGAHCIVTQGQELRTPEGEFAYPKYTDRIVGCEDGARCLVGVGSARPDEGVCALPCGDPDDAACPSRFPRCARGIGTSTQSACVAGPLQLGALCDIEEGGRRSPLFTACDATGPAVLRCLPLPGFPAGVCVEDCGPGDPCVSTDVTNPVECRVVDAATGEGVCVHTNTDGPPDPCAGPGAYGHGRITTRVTLGADAVVASWCTDRIDPALTAGAISSVGRTRSLGEDCRRRPLDPFRCPAPTRCIEREDQSQCLVDCALDDGSECGEVLERIGLPYGRAACVSTGTSTVTGVCGGD